MLVPGQDRHQVAERTPVASVVPHERLPARRWSEGYFNRMPLAGLLLEGEFHIARLDLFGLALTTGLIEPNRIACLGTSHPTWGATEESVGRGTAITGRTSYRSKPFAITHDDVGVVKGTPAHLLGPAAENPRSRDHRHAPRYATRMSA